MEQERLVELLLNAARCFDECYSPFSLEELTRMEVTSKECGELSSWIALIIRDYIELTEAKQLNSSIS